MTEQEMNEIIDDSTPGWVKCGLTVDDIRSIQQGGCASGAYMPAVIYYQAIETMSECGDDVLQYIEEQYGALPMPVESDTSWSGMAVFFLSVAVETWAHSFDVDDIEESSS